MTPALACGLLAPARVIGLLSYGQLGVGEKCLPTHVAHSAV